MFASAPVNAHPSSLAEADISNDVSFAQAARDPTAMGVGDSLILAASRFEDDMEVGHLRT